MKTTIRIIKIFIEICIPLLFGAALNAVSQNSESGLVYFGEIITILFFTILFLEWIRRYKGGEQSLEYFNYLWIVIIIIVFFISVQMIFQSEENHINYLLYLNSLKK
jgi:CDP-diglyceride synthetase